MGHIQENMMTLKEIKGMFKVGDKWRVQRVGGLRPCDELREVHRVGSQTLVFKRLPSGDLIWMHWPKKREVSETYPGYLRFTYSDVPNMEVILFKEV